MSKAAWIEIIEPEEAEGPLVEAYDLAKTPHGSVDNVMKVHSLRPQTMVGHLSLYRSVLHHSDISLPLWFLEVVASYVSLKNNCAYSLTHHWRNAASLIADPPRATAVRSALDSGRPESAFVGKELALLRYAGKLTTDVGAMVEADYEALGAAGATDEEILEVNQVTASFNYSNRLLNGLGVSTDGDAIGYYD
jgi:uncharacterized peroxidase-related enzyme